MNLQLKILRGDEIHIGLTRMSEARIYTGFFDRHDGKNVHFSELRVEDVPYVTSGIRAGRRPCVEIYWNALAPQGGAYVCPDDEATLAAYRQLGISKIPCRILSPKKIRGEDAVVWIKAMGKLPAWAGTVQTDITTYQAIYIEEGLSLSNYISAIKDRCLPYNSAIESFEYKLENEPHYNAMLRTVLRRHIRALDSIKLLVDHDRFEHAFIIIRSVYEAHLNFYLDWLNPEFFGPRFQLLSHIRCNYDKQDGSKILHSLTNFPSLLENTAEKAKASNLGFDLYQNIYRSLSLTAHQTYINVETESDLETTKKGHTGPSFDIAKLWVNVITTALLCLIGNETGQASTM